MDLRDNDQTLLLSAKDAVSQVRISGLTAKPVVSFLRGFSAPVKVSHQRDDAAAAAAMAPATT